MSDGAADEPGVVGFSDGVVAGASADVGSGVVGDCTFSDGENGGVGVVERMAVDIAEVDAVALVVELA